ncbi:hypothetical protein BJ165DRAFT_1410135 [Panaeolus papilionaceus]|nr:hypothetical protein BJ165DRAFT_1410135 [Panaeolus papilionaceus]
MAHRLDWDFTGAFVPRYKPTMVHPGAFAGLRKEFLMSQKPDYEAAVNTGHSKDAIAIIQQKYHKRFPPSLPHDQEPSKEHLDSVNDDEPDEELEEPDKDRLSEAEYGVAVMVHTLLANGIAYRNAQIKRWFAYQYLKDHDLDPLESGAENPYFALLSCLSGTGATAPHAIIPRNLWRKTASAEIEAVVKDRAKATKANLKKGLAGIRATVTTELYNRLPQSERDQWKRMAEEESRVATENWKKYLAEGPSTSPKDRQRYVFISVIHNDY